MKNNSCDLLGLYDLLGKKWTISLLSRVSEIPVSYNELHTISNNVINPTLLSDRLKELMRYGIITKQSLDGRQGYALTEAGTELKEILLNIKAWANNHNLDIPDRCKEGHCHCKEAFVREHNKEVCSENIKVAPD